MRPFHPASTPSSAGTTAPITLRRIDRYEILEPIGKGGFGSVYRARHAHAGHIVALKVVTGDQGSSAWRATPGEARAGDIARLLREARALAEIQHPNVVRVFDCGVADTGEAFVAMELATGIDLEKLLERGPLPIDRALGITFQILEGLAVVHAKGIVHRDIKPANVSVGEGDRIKILDFGISKTTRVEMVTHTRPGTSMGTPGYMAPEQLGAASEADARADVYAVAATLYEMLSGRKPHDAPSYEDFVVKVRTERAPPLRDVAPHVPSMLADVIDRGLARDRDARWPSVDAFSRALRDAMSGAPASTPLSTFQSGPPATYPSAPPALYPSAAPPVAATYPSAPPPTPTHPPARSSVLPIVLVTLGLGAIVLGLGVVGFFYVRGEKSAPQASTSSSAVSSPAPVVSSVAPTPSAQTDHAETQTGVHSQPSATTMTSSRASASSTTLPPITTVAGGVHLSAPRIVGKVPIAVLDDLEKLALPQLPRCRRPGHTDVVVVQLFVQDTGEISMVEPYVAENKGDVETARCVSTRMLDASQHGWNSKGGQGIVRYTVTLDPR